MRLLFLAPIAGLLAVASCPPEVEDDTGGADAMPCTGEIDDTVLAVDLYEWDGERVFYFTTR